MLLLMLVILYNPDFNKLSNPQKCSKIQLKYTLMLQVVAFFILAKLCFKSCHNFQRYLANKLPKNDANKKFLESIYLISHLREMAQLDKKRKEYFN